MISRRAMVVLVLVAASVVFGFLLRDSVFATAQNSGGRLNFWDVAVGAGTNAYYGFGVLIPAWVAVCAIEVGRTRHDQVLLRVGSNRAAAGHYLRSVAPAAGSLVVLTMVVPAMALPLDLPFETGWSQNARITGYGQTLTLPVELVVPPWIIQVTQALTWTALLLIIAVILWLLRTVTESSRLLFAAYALLAFAPLVLDRTAARLSTLVSTVYFTDRPILLAGVVAGWTLAVLGAFLLIRTRVLGWGVKPRWRLSGTATSALVFAALVVAAVLAPVVTDGANLGEAFTIGLGAGGSDWFSPISFASYGFATLAPAAIITLWASHRILPRAPYLALRHGSLSTTIRRLITHITLASLTFWALTAGMVAMLVLLIQPLTGDATGIGITGGALAPWWGLLIQFGPNHVLQIICYSLLLLFAVLAWGPSRGLLTGLLVLVVASLPVLRASYLLPVASSTGGALTDPGLPSPIYSAIVLLIGTLTLCALLFLTAARRRELYLA